MWCTWGRRKTNLFPVWRVAIVEAAAKFFSFPYLFVRCRLKILENKNVLPKNKIPVAYVFNETRRSTENIFLLGWPSSFNVAVLNCSDFLKKKKKKETCIDTITIHGSLDIFFPRSETWSRDQADPQLKVVANAPLSLICYEI